MEVSTENMYNNNISLASASWGGGIRRPPRRITPALALSVTASRKIGRDSAPKGGAKYETEVILCPKSTYSPRMWRI